MSNLIDNADNAQMLFDQDTVFVAPVPPRNLRVLSTNSETITMAWSPPRGGTVLGYNLFGRDSAGFGQPVQFNSELLTDTTLSISGLGNGEDWLMQSQTVDSADQGSLFNECLVRVAAPSLVTGLSVSTANGIVNVEWNENPEPEVVGYRVLRRTSGGDSTSFDVESPNFVDVSARRGYVNTYWVLAQNDLGVFSLPGSPASVIPFAPQQRVLLIDDTGNTNLAAGGLPVDSVHNVYMRIMTELGDDYDYCHGAGCSTLDSLAAHDVVIWVNENCNAGPMADRENVLHNYVNAGGKLVRIARRFMEANLSATAGLHQDPTLLQKLQPLTMDSVFVSHYYTNAPMMKFVGASPSFFGLPNLAVDTARVRTELAWGIRRYPYLPQVDLFWPNTSTSVLYRSVVLPTDSSGFGDEPCGVIGDGVIILSFNLYFLGEGAAADLLRACVDTLRGLPLHTSAPQAPDSLVIQYLASSGFIQLNWAPVLTDTSGSPVDINRYVVYRTLNPDSTQWDSIGTPDPPDTTVFIDFSATGFRAFYIVKAEGR